MDFTYDAYKNLIFLLRENGYEITDYLNCDKYEKCAILRHDIDNDLNKALTLAKIEQEIGVKSTYFVLLATQFYNIAEKECKEKVLKIKELGHNIGLHFDEQNYEHCDVESKIEFEAEIMSNILGIQIKTVSMHRPSRNTLVANYELNGTLINSYGSKFFDNFKYISDSRHCWHEDVKTIVKSNKYPRLQILTHAIWYDDINYTIEETIGNYIRCGNCDRYDAMAKNITDLESIIPKEKCGFEVCK